MVAFLLTATAIQGQTLVVQDEWLPAAVEDGVAQQLAARMAETGIEALLTGEALEAIGQTIQSEADQLAHAEAQCSPVVVARLDSLE